MTKSVYIYLNYEKINQIFQTQFRVLPLNEILKCYKIV